MNPYPQPWRSKYSPYYYFTYTQRSGKRTHKSTRCETLREARRYIQLFMEKLQQSAHTLAEYAEPFYIWNRCPHIARISAENKSMGRDHAAHCRTLIDKYILPSSVAGKKIAEILPGDIIDFRSRLRGQYNDSIANRATRVLKTILKEAFVRRDIMLDPTAGIGNIKTYARPPGTFTEWELGQLFNRDNAYFAEERRRICFLLASEAALRRGEILALQWGDVDEVIRISKARKVNEIGLPKWGKMRVVPTSDKLRYELAEYRQNPQVRANRADDLIVSWDEGSPIATRSFNRWFDAAMKRMGIDKEGRNLKPHSFRHTRITLWKQAGMPQEALQAIVGHTEAETTAGYTHYSEEYLISVLRKFG